MPPKAAKTKAGGAARPKAGVKAATGGAKKKAAPKKKAAAPKPEEPLPEDPWAGVKSKHGGKLSGAEEWLRVQHGELGRGYLIQPGSCIAPAAGTLDAAALAALLLAPPPEPEAAPAAEAWAKAAAAGAEPEPETEPERGLVGQLGCAGLDLKSFKLTQALRGALLGLDLADNSLVTAPPFPLSAGPPPTRPPRTQQPRLRITISCSGALARHCLCPPALWWTLRIPRPVTQGGRSGRDRH